MKIKHCILLPALILLCGVLACQLDFSGKDAVGDDTGDTCDACATLVFAGDVMMGGDVEKEVTDNHDGNYAFLFANIAGYLQSFDVAFCNLESMISSWGIPLGSDFRAKPAAIDGLLSAGIDVVSVANDHVFDFTNLAFINCLSNLSDAGIVYAGGGADWNEANDVRVFDLKGTRVALVAFSTKGYKSNEATNTPPKSAGIAFLESIDDPDLKEGIWDAYNMDSAEVVIVSLHFGESLADTPSDEQKSYAHSAIDFGADLVIGHNPNVVQPVEYYNGGVIAYSLGNLVHMTADEGTLRGMLLEVTVQEGAITGIRQRYVVRNQSFQPELEALEQQ